MSVTVIRVLGERQRLWDSSSGLRGNYKEIEDSLVAAGWFHDDGPEWIEETRFRQDAGHRHVGPATIVVVHEISEEIDVDSIVDNVII